MSQQSHNFFAGTQVVSLVEVRGTNNSLVHPRGAVGVVTRTPTGDQNQFLLRFPDGFEASLTREQLDVLKHFKDRLPGAESATPDFDLENLVIYRCLLGSRAYALGMSQFKKIEQDIRNSGQIKWKHAMHLLRLLLTGAATLRDARVPVRVEAHRDRLLAVKHGEMPWAEVDAWRKELHRDFERALTETKLPERPDYEAANRFLIRARRQMTNPGSTDQAKHSFNRSAGDQCDKK